MSRKNIENIYSLSPMQQGMLFHALYDESPGVYVVEIAWTLRGPLDRAALQSAWQAVVDRHPVLRTAFVWERLDKPMQVVRKRIPLALEEVDLGHLCAGEQAERAARLEDELGRRRYDLTRAPLMRVALLRLRDDLHRLVWSAHHLILDGWSLPIVVREVFTLYEAHVGGRAPTLERARPYGDYIAWLVKQDLGKAEAYWRAQLAGFTVPTSLPEGRVVVQEGFDKRTWMVGEPEVSALSAFARRHQLTMSTLVQGAFALLLARYSGEDDIVYGSTVSGRSAPVPGIDQMVGLFINTLPVRVRVPEGVTAVDWLRGLQDQQAELREYEHSPLVQIQGWSELPRGAPLFESQVAFENYPSAETLFQGGGGLAVADAQMSSQTHFPLTFLAVARRTLSLRAVFDRRRFDGALVERMLSHFCTLLDAMASLPASLWELPLVPEDERRQLISGWNDTRAAYSTDTTVHRLFEERVAKSPDSVVLVAGGQRLTYQELDRRAHRLARRLAELGVGRESMVGLWLDRSAEMVIGILGVLEAGGAYVPLDPAYPAQRLAQLCDEAGARVVITTAGLAPPRGREERVFLDQDWVGEPVVPSPPSLAEGERSADLVYVLFTSGSTGTPKGVAIEHRNLVNYILGAARRIGLPESASYAHVSTFAADLGNTSLYLPLCQGGTLHVIPPELATDPRGLGEYFQAEGIDCLKIAPSHLVALLCSAHPERVLPRAIVILGGEGLSYGLIDRMKSLAPGLRIMNHYAPSECTVGVLTLLADEHRRLPGASIAPLGRPLPGSRVYVVDRQLAPVPVGVPGEILVAGAGVGRGYLGRPDLTRERFMADPFCPGERAYRSGDRGRRLADGTLAFLGRVDFQVKIRGFRVELGEIEAAIPGHDVVVLAGEGPAGPRLVAYLVGDAGLDVAALRADLAARLPDYMVPSAFVVLPAMPRTPNGKIDRSALAALEAQPIDEDAAPVAPRNPIEEVIAGIWCEVFQKDRVGVHDRFTDLGGHSLFAIQIMARIREAFQRDLPLRVIFEAPTIAGLAEQVETAMRAGVEAPPPMQRLPRDRAFQLSFAQERLWFLHQLDPESPHYNVPIELQVCGKLDIDALEQALQQIVRRHEVLRTTFRSQGGKPVQVVHPDMHLRVDVALLPDPELARREVAAEARRPFDLSRGPLLRARVFLLGDDESILLLTLHHIVSDGWTRGVFYRELSALYRAYHTGSAVRLPELPIQYVDYAEWQRQWLSGATLERLTAYWKDQLDGAPQALELPVDRPRPPVQSYRGDHRTRALSAEVGKALRELARRQGLTLYMVLLGALDLLLHRWTGQRDLVIGTSVENRSHAETERLMGFFVNALALRSEVDEDLPFTALLQRVREVCLGAYAHQDMPFERLVQELSPEPDPSRAPLFQVIFTMLSPPGEPLALPGLTLRAVRADAGTAKYDLTFVTGEGRNGVVVLSIDYNVDLFDGATIDRMIGHLANLLQEVARDASRKACRIPMLPDDEQRMLLGAWHDTSAWYSTDDCAHELFEARAEETTDAIAVVSGDARLSFGALDLRANRLARHLSERGVGPESVVGLFLERSAEAVVAILGILKAGGAYLPLEPAHPAQRIAQSLRDAGARVVVTGSRLAARLPAETVVLAGAGEQGLFDEDGPASGVASQNLAYVLFTSGSTGIPKAVCVEHRNLVNYIRGVATRVELPSGSSYAHVSRFSADVGNTALYLPLCTGGTLHLIPDELTTDPAGFGAYAGEHGIDCLKIVPSHLSALLTGAHPERVLPRELVVVGGEGLSWELCARIQEISPATRILNHYAPTECTVGAVTYPVTAGERPPTPIAPLGRPLPNSRVYVLSAHMTPVPIGAHGEIYIGGAGVSRGYLGQPELTRRSFVADTLSGTPGARLYKSGDRGRFLPDGTLVFLGRADFQVKVRGYRVELGEVEAALTAHPGVKDAVVLAHDTASLAAYVVPCPGEGPSAGELRAWVEQRLPEHMVPSAYVSLDTLPLTGNGKVDRRALRALALAEDHGKAWVAPRTPVEEVLEGIWCEVFRREHVGVHERFSELGGHSLLAIQIVARAREAFHAALPLRAIFEAPTIAGLAERIEAAIREGTAGRLPPPITRAPREGALPLSFAQERLWFLEQLDPGNVTYNVPLRVRLAGQLDVGALERALQEILRRHEVLRTTFETVAGTAVQLIQTTVDLRLPVVDIGTSERESALRREALKEQEEPFDLARGPLLRARLLRLAPTEHVLLLTMHHIVSDAWAKGVLYRELASLYEAFLAGQPPALGELPIQYADFAVWQRAWLSGATLASELSFWRAELAGAPAALELFTDRPRPPLFRGRGARRRFALKNELCEPLRALARREGATLFMTLLAAFDALLFRYTGQSNIVVGTPIAGRTRPELEPLVGFFVNTLVIHARLSGDLAFAELLARVREACLGAYAHQDVPFERIVTELSPARDLGRTPLFQVAFVFQDEPAEQLRLSSLSLSGVDIETSTAKFELTLGLVRTPAGLRGTIEYSTDLYEASTIDRMAGHLEALLADIVAWPDKSLWDLAVMPEAERDLLLDWGGRATPYPREACLHELFEAQVESTPDAAAVTFEGETLTYRALDTRAGRWARRLRGLGVRADTLVGVCAERSTAIIVALVAILKAGGAYVPLDPTYPRERLSFMIEDAGARLLLAQRVLSDVLPDGCSFDVLYLEDPCDGESQVEHPREVTAENLAYVIYTSGSTGVPKGVAVTHRSVVRLVRDTNYVDFRASDRIAQMSNMSFDAATFEVWGALLNGGCLIGFPKDLVLSPEAFELEFRRSGITACFVTVALFNSLVRERPSVFSSGRCVLFGGDAADPTWVRAALRDGPERLLNGYGPTEATTFATYYPVGEVPDGATNVPIGRPLSNTTAHVLDARLGLVPIGVAGELFLGGDAPARCYLNRPALTAERFLPDPTSADPSARLYRTGDWVRRLASGDIEYLRRVDHQVKVRGFRVELGEIEALLGQHPSVREVVVVAREDSPGDKRLVAYVVMQGDVARPSVTDLRGFVRQKLPEVMVPAAFVVLDALPLTENGKVDRRALPAPEEGNQLDRGEELTAARTAVEQELARIWASVLRLSKVGIHDNYFAVGGDSILSIQIVSRAQAAGIHLTPRQVFQHQTIAELASAASVQGAAPEEQGPVTGQVPFTPIQLWWLEQDLPEPDHDNQSYFLEAEGPLDAPAVRAALAALLDHHDMLRLRVSLHVPSQALAEPGGEVPMVQVDLRALPQEQLKAAIEAAAAEAQRSLDIAEGPILRAVLFDLGAGRPARLLVVIHHLAVDGVSWRILIEDLATAYGQASRGEPICLPPKTTSFKRWAEHLGTVDVRSRARERGARNTEASARSVVVSLSPEETRALLREAPDAYRTQINDVLLTALVQAWEQPALRLDLEAHGRDEAVEGLDLTRTVGWFTAIFPVHLELPQGAGPGEALKSVKEQLRAAPHRGVAYGVLRYLRGDEGATAAPDPEVSFNYLGQLDQTSQTPVFRRAREWAGPAHGPRNPRRHRLDIGAAVVDDRLQARFTYSEDLQDRATVEGLSSRFVAALRALVAHCLDPQVFGYTPSDFPRVRLAQDKLDLLAARVPGRGLIQDIHPLSPMQQGILFHALFAAEPGAYYVELGWTITGKLDVPSFAGAFQDVIDRHLVLRTAVLWEGLDKPLALVLSRALLPFYQVDLRGRTAPAAEIERHAAEQRRRGFDLGQAPLLRVSLLRLGEGTFRFILGAHHIILDGWSVPILLKEALELYEGRAQGRCLRLDPVRPFTDYVDWLAAQDSSGEEAFWRRQLAGFTAPTPLPERDGGSRGERFAEARVRFSREESAPLAAFVRAHQLTMSTLVQGAFAVLLARYSGEWDICFGATVSGRSAPVPGIDRMVGLFINTLAVRVALDPEGEALAFLRALHEQEAELREHEHTPLAEVQAWSAVPRGSPLFESLVVFENHPVEEALQKARWSVAFTDPHALERPPYPLTLQCSFRGHLLLRVGFDVARFDEALASRMMGHLTMLLRGMTAAPEERLSALGLLTDHERHKLLSSLNDTAFSHPRDLCIHEVFAVQAARTPDAVAVSFEREQLGYGEMNRRANQLAQVLAGRGVGPDVLVGVCMERSLELLVALYGVLKAGGAYVPLDPEYPKERLDFMLEDARPAVILTGLAGPLADGPSSLAEERAQGGGGVGGERSLAYVIYTSGSTGRPNGAMNEHAGILNRLLWMQRVFGLTAEDRVLQKTPFSFDVSVWELFWPLMFGARLVVARPGGHRDPAYLVDTIAAEGITIMHFVPSMLKVFLDEAGHGRASSLTRVFASGEALSPALVERFYAALPGARLHNLYGPTEAAVDVSWWACERGATMVPIGKPIDNVRMYVLDERMQLVPEGIRGELYIGGVQVGRGYLNRPELTAARFLEDPFVPGARLYKTGDLARYLPTGDVAYLGRADFQVKLRGFRVELGEIEARLQEHPAVREAVVVAREDAGTERRLVAYLVCAAGEARPDVGALRSSLGRQLPDHMIPAAFVVLPSLPLTRSGKVDRRALPAPEEGDRVGSTTAFVAPSTPVEEELARIWTATLRLQRVGVRDNYFELGGDSILSIQIVARARQAGIHLTPRQVFEHPTVGELAAVAGLAEVVAVEQGPVTGELPLTPIQRWWLETPRADPHHWNLSVFLELREPVDAVAMGRAFARLLEHHDALRLRLTLTPEPRQVIAAPGEAPFHRVDLGGIPPEARAAALEEAAATAQASLDLAAGPLARAVLFDGDPQRLLLVVHHLCVDTVSWSILLEDLWSAYAQARRGLAMTLPDKTTSYKRWAELLHAGAPAPADEESYWRTRSRAVARRLPVDLERGLNTAGSARTVLVSLAAAETEQLLREVPDAYRTQINDLLLTALAQALAGWTGAPGALFDFEGHGREERSSDVDLTRSVGWYTVVYPVALELPARADAGDAIKSVKEQLRAIPSRGLGYGVLRYLQGEEPEALAGMPAAEVCYNYLGQVDQTLPEGAPFRWASGSAGPAHSPRGARRYLLDVNARISAGRLHVGLTYSEERHRRETIEALGASLLAALRALIAHCVSPEARGHTPSDFEDANLSQDAIDMLVNAVADDEV